MSDKVTVTLAPFEVKPVKKQSLLEQIIAVLWPYLMFTAGAFTGWILRGME